LLNLLGPILFILGFYALLGAGVWLIFRRPSLPIPAGWSQPHTWQKFWRPPTRWQAQDPTTRRAQSYALIAAGVGLLLLLLPGPQLMRFGGVQLIAIAILLVLLDQLQQQRRRQERRTTTLAALTGLSAERAADALALAQAEGWLTDGSLSGLAFQHANWPAANLSDATLDRVHLAGANLHAIIAVRASLQAAILDQTNLDAARLDGARLQQATLRGARVRGASLRAADLTQADLREARLQNTDLTGATLCYAQLAAANLKGAVLVGVDLTGATYTEQTKWPKHFLPTAAGAHLIADTIPAKLTEQSTEALR
jgi:uncharacterized protein YjbI with pentapeptide repeats